MDATLPLPLLKDPELQAEQDESIPNRRNRLLCVFLLEKTDNFLVSAS